MERLLLELIKIGQLFHIVFLKRAVKKGAKMPYARAECYCSRLPCFSNVLVNVAVSVQKIHVGVLRSFPFI